MPERSTRNRKPASGEEGDAGEAAPINGSQSPRATLEDLRDGPLPGWRAGTIALDSAGAKAEGLGLEGYERLASEDDPEGHIIRGQE